MSVSLKLLPEPAPDDPLRGFGSHLVDIEKDIRSNDLASLKSRHQSGACMLRLRGENGRLPLRARQALVDDLGVSAREVNYRMKLAEKYQVGELGTLVRDFVTWDNIRRNALSEKRSKPKPKTRNTVPLATSARTFTKKIEATDRLTAADRRALRDLIDSITQLLGDAPASEAS